MEKLFLFHNCPKLRVAFFSLFEVAREPTRAKTKNNGESGPQKAARSP